MFHQTLLPFCYEVTKEPGQTAIDGRYLELKFGNFFENRSNGAHFRKVLKEALFETFYKNFIRRSRSVIVAKFIYED